MNKDELDRRREEVALGCRVLAARELAPGILGHISLRVDESHLLIRCRGPHERGLAYTTARDIRLVDLSGLPGAAGELDDYSVPYELPLHTRVLVRRPEVTCVVHAHPRDVVAADLAGLPILPIVGAYDIPGAALAHGGVPVFPRAALICTPALGDAVADSLGDRPLVIMRGHGLTSTGSGVAEAVLRAISVDAIASISLSVASAGGTVRSISAEDLAELPDLGAGLNLAVAWRHELARLGDSNQPKQESK
ncbi:class II aldolase/adducin family protein [Nocardia sp. SYP-A9097]|uniref:class II aldolase/adducin family protein n=1 Tax=Nocardia sp. SYP-A9097 TaxID=2663237 RepID=UPI00132C132D|nr:class II aldolase/adducin family protein [Nocardia sp. SYP-A9097]MRH91786.1 class II aldolase/adducin family protein [Nocardia sp. SYP-A9097]